MSDTILLLVLLYLGITLVVAVIAGVRLSRQLDTAEERRRQHQEGGGDE